MTLGPFRVGDRPADPLEITVSRPGDPDPMSGFNAAQIEMVDGAGVASEWPATIAGTKVSAVFPAAFAVTGQHRVRAHLTGPGGASEWTEWGRFWVRPAL